jgi:hypothetical protein
LGFSPRFEGYFFLEKSVIFPGATVVFYASAGFAYGDTEQVPRYSQNLFKVFSKPERERRGGKTASRNQVFARYFRLYLSSQAKEHSTIHNLGRLDDFHSCSSFSLTIWAKSSPV